MRAATRGSALALWQTHHVAALLQAIDPRVTVDPVVVETTADRRLDIPIDAMGGKGVFVKEVQAALLDGRADFAVHSAKDLPSLTADGLVLIAVPERGDARDVLVGSLLEDLADGAPVATGSARRRVQLAHLRPDLRFSGLRGNIATRLAKLGQFDAIVMAKAALDRLELHLDVPVDVLDDDRCVPQVGQGALAIECRADDEVTRSLLVQIQHAITRRAVDAERAFLAELGGDCTLPAGAYAVVDDDYDTVRITGVLATPDEAAIYRRTDSGADGEVLGRELARALLGDVGGNPVLP